jgi:hypothetical protein
MATIDSRELIDKLIASNGEDPWPQEDGYPPDPPVVKIVEYTTPEGATTWGIVYEGEDVERYNRPSNFVRNPRTIFARKSG